MDEAYEFALSEIDAGVGVDFAAFNAAKKFALNRMQESALEARLTEHMQSICG